MKCYQTSIYDILHKFSEFAIPLYLSVFIPVCWFVIRKLIEIRTACVNAFDNANNKIVRKSRHSYIDRIDNLIFWILVTGLLFGALSLKIKQHKEEVNKKDQIISNIKQHKKKCNSKCSIAIDSLHKNIGQCGIKECEEMGIDSACFVDVYMQINN